MNKNENEIYFDGNDPLIVWKSDLELKLDEGIEEMEELASGINKLDKLSWLLLGIAFGFLISLFLSILIFLMIIR